MDIVAPECGGFDQIFSRVPGEVLETGRTASIVEEEIVSQDDDAT